MNLLRINDLREIRARVRFLSLEPLLTPIEFWTFEEEVPTYGLLSCVECAGTGYFQTEPYIVPCSHCLSPEYDPSIRGSGLGIQWCIFGCESGPNRRPCENDWVEIGVGQCHEAGVPVFVKQLQIKGRVSHAMNEWPASLRVREMPHLNARAHAHYNFK